MTAAWVFHLVVSPASFCQTVWYISHVHDGWVVSLSGVLQNGHVSFSGYSSPQSDSDMTFWGRPSSETTLMKHSIVFALAIAGLAAAGPLAGVAAAQTTSSPPAVLPGDSVPPPSAAPAGPAGTPAPNAATP